VTGPRGSVLVQVVDLCPADAANPKCGTSGHLDLSPAAFAAIADPVDGFVAVAWEMVACPETGSVRFHFHRDTNPWWLAVQPRGHRYPIASLELWDGGRWVHLERQPYNYFTLDSRHRHDGPFRFRLTDVQGQVLEAGGIPLRPGSEVASREPPPPDAASRSAARP